MRPPQLAAVVKHDRLEANAIARLEHVLNFLGIPYRVFEDESHLAEEGLNGSLRGHSYSVLEPITAIRAVGDECSTAIETTAHSRFVFLINDIAACSEKLRLLTGSREARLKNLGGVLTDVVVSREQPSLTSAMHGLEVRLTARPDDYALQATGTSPVEAIISSKDGVLFFATQQQGLRTYVSCSAAIPDLQRSANGRAFDVKDEFLSIVPLFTYLRCTFREVCWQPNEHGACLIIDDPVLKTRYGCCDFREIDKLMKEHSFTTNISFIPWNQRRTSREMSNLVRNSDERFSVSIHGCNHTGGEFGITNIPTLDATVGLAQQRMESHRTSSGIAHERVMVFPQGVFSKESLAVLQQNQFIAAVNTKVLPANADPQELTVQDVCSTAILKYYSFPLFTRRYPEHGLENFAFDLVLGKPCFIVEHHAFFADGGHRAVEFIDKVNSLNCPLRWRSLTSVIRRAFLSRPQADGATQIRMFANEMTVTNLRQSEQFYRIEKADCGSAGIKEIFVNDAPASPHFDNTSLNLSGSIPAGSNLNVRVSYQRLAEAPPLSVGIKGALRVATRRYLCEFRDNFLCRHKRLMRSGPGNKAIGHAFSTTRPCPSRKRFHQRNRGHEATTD